MFPSRSRDLLDRNAIKAFVSRVLSMLPDAKPSTIPLNVPDKEMVEAATEEDIHEDLEPLTCLLELSAPQMMSTDDTDEVLTMCLQTDEVNSNCSLLKGNELSLLSASPAQNLEQTTSVPDAEMKTVPSSLPDVYPLFQLQGVTTAEHVGKCLHVKLAPCRGILVSVGPYSVRVRKWNIKS